MVCASTGNTSASMAAYAAQGRHEAARAGPRGQDRRRQDGPGDRARRADHQVRGNFDDCLDLARDLADDYPVALVNSVNPVRLEGQKTASFEIVDFLGDAPDVQSCRSATPATSRRTGRATASTPTSAAPPERPAMWGFQAEGAAPLVTGEPFPDPETKATAIRDRQPGVVAARRGGRDESGGRFEAVTDAQILAAQRELARQ